MAVLDFGLSGTITRFYSKYLTLGDSKGQASVLAISGIIYCFLTVLILIVGLGIYINIEYIFSNSLNVLELEQAKSIFIVMLINIAFIVPSNIFTAIIDSKEKFIFIRSLLVIQNILKPVIVLMVLNYKSDIMAFVIAQTAFNFSIVIVKAYYAMIVLKTKIKFYNWDNDLIKEILKFAFFIFLNVVIDQIYWKTDQVILGIVSGTGAVAVYSIASQLDLIYIQLSSNINNVFFTKTISYINKN